MTATIRYRNAFGATNTFNVDLGNTTVRLGSVPGLTELAEHLSVGSSTVIIDDASGTVGHSSDALLGLQLMTWDESAASAGNQRVYTGIIDYREYARGDSSRGSLRTGVSRQITVSLNDLNALPGFRVIPQTDTTAKRPAETVKARLTWILGSTYLSGLVADNGLVADASAFTMTAADYRGQRPVNVINDCELAANWFAFVYPDETQTVLASLFFDDANVSTAYTSTVKLSNVLADIDGSTVFGSTNGVLKRTPQDVGDGVYLPYTKGAVYRTRSATTATYGHRDLIASNANLSDATHANQEADNFLWAHHTEEDRITCEVQVPAASVNLIRAGHRIQVKFSHLPGYTSYTWCRVLSRSPGQPLETDQRYTLTLELSPQEAGPSAARIVQSAFGRPHDNLPLPNPVTIGNVLIVAISDRDQTNPSAPNIVPGVLPTLGGTGAWTRMSGATLSSSQTDGAAFYYKTATATDQTAYQGDSQSWAGVWELAGANPASATIVYVDQGTSGPDYALGSLGTLAAGQIAMALWIFGDTDWPWGSPGYSWAVPDPAPGLSSGWTLRWSKWAFDSYVGPWYKVEHPWATFADAVGTGASLAATITPGLSSKNYGGIAIKVPAL
jgi:hypothetical protein